jgi:D-glycero-alpha-D-manno-heptose-7-phosphate kinase
MYLGSDVEPNSGLGASSSLTSNLVNVISTIQQKKINKNNIAMKAYHIGHDILKWGIGKQDEFAAVYGGLNSYKYSKNKVIVKPININKNTIKELEKNSLLFRLGNRKHSANILKKQIKNINESNEKTLNALHSAKKLAIDMRDALKSNDLEKFAELLNKGWSIKKQYASGITNTGIDKISKKAFDSGATSLKVTGAGGGGHLFIYAEPKKHKTLENNLKKLGVNRVDFSYYNTGAAIFNINNL